MEDHLAVSAPGSIGPAARTYLADLTAALGTVLDGDLTGVWLVGSGSRDDYIPGRSDLDVIAAVARRLTESQRRSVVSACRHEILPCPTSGVELVLYEPARAPAYEVNLNGGLNRPFYASIDAREDDGPWFAVDLASSRTDARPLYGPSFVEVFPKLDPNLVRQAVLGILDWQLTTEPAAPNSVLNACRAWLWAAEGVWASKTAAAMWARDADPDLIDAALAARRGLEAAELHQPGVVALLEQARDAVAERVHRIASA